MNITFLKKTDQQMSESYGVGIILALVGGFLDAYTYICRGNVFANAQTGNMVLLALKISEGKIAGALYYIVPIIAFILGTMTAEIIRAKFWKNENIHWRQIIILLEIMILAVTVLIPQGRYDMIVNVLISYVCALQVESFRKINGNSYTTTMCTGNLRSATELLFLYIRTKDRKYLSNSSQYFGIIGSFISGAVFGTIFTRLLSIRSIWLCCLLLFVVVFLLFYRGNSNQSSGEKKEGVVARKGIEY